MKMHDEAAKLRRELRERGVVRGKRFEPELRARVIRFAKERRHDGASWIARCRRRSSCRPRSARDREETQEGGRWWKQGEGIEHGRSDYASPDRLVAMHRGSGHMTYLRFRASVRSASFGFRRESIEDRDVGIRAKDRGRQGVAVERPRCDDALPSRGP